MEKRKNMFMSRCQPTKTDPLKRCQSSGTLRNYGHIKLRKCMLPFGLDSFVILFSIKANKTYETVIVPLCMEVKSRSVAFREEHQLRGFFDEGAEENIQT
jgi:hypothetical protein